MNKDLSLLREAYIRLGFNETTGKPRLKGILYIIIVPILLINQVYYVIYNWHNIEKRANGINALSLYVISLVYLAQLILNYNETKLLMKFVEEGNYRFPFRPSEERIKLEQSIKDSSVHMTNTWYYLLIVFTLTALLTPFIVFLKQIRQYGIRNISTDMLHLVLPVYYPEDYDTLPYYFLSFGLQIFYWIQIPNNAYVLSVSAFICFQLIEGDLRLLRLTVEEMESEISCHTIEPNQVEQRRSDANHVTMELFLRHIVKNHIDIYRKVTEASNSIQVITFSACTSISFMVCTSIYSFVTGDVLIYKVQTGCYCFTILYCLYCFTMMGQKICNEDENLRHALYMSSWTDKPQWYKKSFHIIMTRTNKTIQIKSNGLYTLNLHMFMQTAKTAYALYNVLINYKS